MSNTHGSTHCIRQCDRAGRLLRESLKLSYAKQNEQIVQVGLYTHNEWICFLQIYRRSKRKIAIAIVHCSCIAFQLSVQCFCKANMELAVINSRKMFAFVI